ncbi:carboxymuconolactone decarboxylase family protein [Massilia horti]|uniref:Carboxymuconolactone decarboxylase family protein n=1 Tax=Massilia horti TaxID=2562153 RepID=A0A4Y9T5T3_9BURK|nr:carboxymuconolactone decarboxylase family protein [Massilia horti]TFW35646.1 carboxymuconolactone decarboxylase family protein [Massilia horti]
MKRIPDLDPATLSEEQKRIYDEIASGPRKGVRGPLAVWLRRPGLAATAQALGRYCRYETSLPPRLSELAILILGRAWSADYEWAAHKPIALAAGLPVAVVDAIRDRRPPPFEAADEALVYEFMTTLHAEHTIPDALYQRAGALLGLDGVIDLVGIAGYYTLISMTIKAFDLMPADGSPREMTEPEQL